MALHGVSAIFYYGLFASITGGYLPLRVKNLWLVVFHLYLFLTFIIFPLVIYFVSRTHWAGWFVYSLFVLVSFIVLKVVNLRLHLSLGTDPIPEPDRSDHEAADNDKEEEKEESKGDGSLDNGPTKEELKAAEAGLTLTQSNEEDKSLPSHRDSTELNRSTSILTSRSGVSHSYELQVRSSPGATSRSGDVTVVEIEKAAQKNIEENSKDRLTVTSSRSADHTLHPISSDDPSSVALMSPVHRSSSNMDTSYTTVVAMLDDAASREELEKIKREASERHSISEGSSPPRRDRATAGICLQRNHSLRQDENRIDTDSLEEGSIHHHRRYAMRSGARPVIRRHSSPATAVTIIHSSSTPTLSPLPSSPLPPSQPEDVSPSERNTLMDKVKNKLYEDEHYALMDVVGQMPTPLLEAIFTDCVPESCYENLSSRVEELNKGHLASGDADSSSGAIHWFEVTSGEWNFYVFETDNNNDMGLPSSSQEDRLSDEDLDRYLHQEILLRYGLDMDSSLRGRRPTPPPRERPAEEATKEEEKKPTFEIIPYVKRTTVTLKFARKILEEFMDRNVTWSEAFGTVFLATMVCVITALLLSVVDFYQGFWVFWLCFVVGTAHFSLVKSVQDDPASPSPGQNHITAMSRAIYFIVVGVLALCIDAALRHIDIFKPEMVYGFDVNSRVVLMFVRDGLLIFILFFPILFALGWLPQANTFTIYFCEQLDMHIFGGTPATGLVCALYALGRSVAVAGLLWPLGYAAFYTLQLPARTRGMPDYSPDDPGMSCVVNDRVALSFYLGALFTASFILSRSTSNHQYLWDLILRGLKKCMLCISRSSTPNTSVSVDFSDPLEDIYCQTLRSRLLYDLLAGIFIFIFVTGLNLTTIFCLSPIPSYVIYALTCVIGLVNHYLIPHLRKEMPWLLCSEPIAKPRDWDSFEVTEDPKLSVVEYVLQMLLFAEKNILYPLTFIFAFNLSAHHYKIEFGEFGAALVVTVAGMKILRSAWTELSRQHFVLIFTLFFFSFDYAHLSEGFPLNYFIIAILFNKFYDLLLKMYFIYIYIAPWQTSWSSAGHIIVQPLLIPHTPIIFLQTLISSVMSAPINPVYASTLFILSYVRPVKYWEKDYNTKRADSSNTRLDLQLEGSLRNPNPDRLDSLFYEHLTWVLQKDLCGDLELGRWGNVTNGDIFILTSDRLNALVHIIEYGNGFVTFQLRGLEFRGTYCHQREVEAITESVANDESCCCFEPGHLPGFLSCNKTFGSRWLAWQVVSSCYTLHGYSITENQAHLVFNSFDYRRGYITYYCKCIIYKLITSSRLKTLLENSQLQDSLEAQHRQGYVDPDPLFDDSRNCDYTRISGGIERDQFVSSFLPFIQVCVEKQNGLEVEHNADSFLVTLCFAYTLLGRRMFFQHAQQGSGRRGGDNFMHGLYRMFLGDARPHSANDEWVFSDVDSIQEIIIPAARIALKVHQDNFTFSEEYDSPAGVYEAIEDVETNHIVTHENDRAWRTAVIMNKPSMLALRYQRTEDSYVYPYKLIRLTSKFIKFRVVKLNRECVRSLWTSQQHELIFLRNSDSERGSIQNHKPTLRNMVNSSMDLPIGYPIYVSPLQTSYIDRHQTYNNTLLGKITNPLEIIKAAGVVRGWCDACSRKMSGSRNRTTSKGDSTNVSTSAGIEGSADDQIHRGGSVDSLTGIQYGAEGQSYEDPFPDSDSDGDEQLWKPMWVSKTVVISNASEIFENFNVSWLKWKDVSLAQKAMKSHWKAWRPQEGMEGEVVHEWRPFHIEAVQRSHIDKVILLVKMTEDLYVLVKEQGVKEV